MPAGGRGGVQVLERLGPESAQNLYSPAPPGPCRGLQNLCRLCMAGRNPTRSLLLRRNNQYVGLRVPARGRGGVQVLERLGPESAQNLYSPAPSGPCRGLHRTCAVFVWREGTLHVRYFIGETINTRACGCRPGDAGEYRFWNAWGLKVPKTCTPPRPPGNAGYYRTCAVFVWREGTLHVRYFLGGTISKRACGCRPGDAEVLERLGPESAQNLYSPAPPGPCRGLQNLCCLCMAGRNPTRSLLLRRNNQYAGLRVPAGDAGEYRFWNAWGLKVPKTCTPPRPPGHAGDYTELVLSLYGGKEPYTFVTS